MKKLLLLLLMMPLFVMAQNQSIRYHLLQIESSKKVRVTIELDSINAEDAFLVIPRSAPGTYELTDYQSFVDQVVGLSTGDEEWKGQHGMGSYFFFNEEGYIKSISYEVNIARMEAELKGGFASSKYRDDYLGMLGYSVFGFVRGTQNQLIELTITSEPNWPIFSTLAPEKSPNGTASYEADDYATLADAQYLLGEGVQILKVEETEIPLFVAVYSEQPVDIQEIGRRGKISLEGLANYFGFVPMPHYTLCYEFLVPYTEAHSYGFSMEHLNSMTASLDTSRVVTGYDPKARIGSIVHHMGHSWVPLRSYGVGYRPFEWESAPIIETIWLNEGFIWYVMSRVLDQPSTIQFFERVVANAPDYIQRKNLKELSQLGSTQYSADFNIGRNLFSRGALMAKEMDETIQRQTDGKKTFKDALIGLIEWTDDNQRGFEYEEIEPILSNATGVDLSEVWEKWQEME